MADWQRLAPRLEVSSFTRPIPDPDDLVQALRPFDAVLAMRERTRFPRQVLDRLPGLRLLVTTGMWNAAIDIEHATALGVQVCGTRDVGHLTAELTLGLMLALSRQITHEERALRAGLWQTRLGAGLQGKTLGIVGLGNLGLQVCRFGQMMGMDTLAWSENLADETARGAGAERVEREALFARSDYVSIHLRLSERTRGLIGAADLGRMKPSAYLINTSRGPIVDEPALLDVLHRRAIAGAALDVYETEPLPMAAPIRSLDNVILLPHLGYVSQENWRLMYGDGLEDVEAFLDGKPVRVLNMPRRR
jgi:phosphoglycerate dehydrogenase-like enzyme